ncbi:glycosyltransferase family 2 protein [Tolypothrix campylonemoides VB511288]|nr:glycosyltransferase family 2 protein [Tolypothrix campylonemoides VB511288]
MVLESTPIPEREQLQRHEDCRVMNPLTQANEWTQILSVSIIVPAYNEGLIIEKNLGILCQHMEALESKYKWELIIINDGSKDNTGELAETFAKNRNNVSVVHHLTNCGLGQALRSGFKHCQGNYIITLDLDLSYSPEHIEQLLSKIRQTRAKVVLTSPYMKGGKVSNVPWLRLFLSVWANRFLSFATKGKLSTLTGMVRVYDASFLRSLNLRSTGMDINAEVIHKAMLLNAEIEEIPAHLSWHPQKVAKSSKQARRKSSMKILRHTWNTLFYGFVLRPVIFFIIPSLVFFLLCLYVNTSILIDWWTNYQRFAQTTQFPDPTQAVASAFRQDPYTFFIGGITLMLAIQLFSLGILSLQSKHYFQEIFSLGTAIYDNTRKQGVEENLECTLQAEGNKLFSTTEPRQ